MATLSVGGTTIFDGSALQSGVTGVLPVGVTGGSGLDITLKPAFKYEGDGSTQTSIPQNTYTRLNFPTLVYDTGSHYVTATDRFLPTDGVSRMYHFYATMRAESGSSWSPYILVIRKNDVAESNTRGDNTSYSALQVAAVTELNGTSDYVDVYAYCNSAISCHANAKLLFFGGYALTRT